MLKRTRFRNLDDIDNVKSWKEILRWRRERKSKIKDLDKVIPQAETKREDFLQDNRSLSTITWVGHSTFLLQMSGSNILTDPVWAASMGMEKRQSPPGIALERLPEIDVVVISHGHYDHLDFPTLRKLKGNPLYLVPMGLKRLFLRKGFSRVEELAWWEDFHAGDIQFAFVPAQHWTRRGLFDTNTSHWGGWVIQSDSETVYFAGDTGYFRGFREIGARFNIDYALMPIGAYEPEWFMKNSHIGPEDAVKAFTELNAKYFIPMHYGTFRLADDTGPEALARFEQAWEDMGLNTGSKLVLKLGETVIAEKKHA